MAEASVSVSINVSETEQYKTDVVLPFEPISETKPFRFKVTQTKDKVSSDVLFVEVKSSSNFTAIVKPPKSVLDMLGSQVGDLSFSLTENK